MIRLDTLFKVSYGHKLDMNKMALADKATGIAFVGRRGSNQGVAGHVKPLSGLAPHPAGLITVALGGSRLLSSYVQQRPFYTAQNVAVLDPCNPEMPLKHRLYYAMCIRHNAFRYTAFGREANRTLGSIEVPEVVPPWVDIPMPVLDGLSNAAGPPVPLGDPTQWAEFTLGSLFVIRKGRRLPKAVRYDGATRFIGASEKNNGVTDLSDVPPLFEGGCLTVAYNGNSVGWAFYQDRPFFACDDVNVLEPRVPVSKWALLFVASVIKHGRSRYTYGFKWTQERMIATRIRLPATETGTPDWEHMEAVMRGLPCSAAIKTQ